MLNVYPALPGLTWPITRTPTFKTITQQAVSGREVRATFMQYPIYEFTLRYAYLSASDLEQLKGFFLQQQGSLQGFWFDAGAGDDSVSNQLFATGDGATSVYTLLHAIGAYTEPIDAVAGTPTIYTSASYGGGTGVENRLAYSQDFTQSAWTKTTGTTVTANTTTAPDGTSTGDTIAYDGTGSVGATRLWQGSQKPAAGTPVTFSIWLKVATGNVYIQIGNNFVYQTVQATSSWQRFQVTGTADGVGVAQGLINSPAGDNSAWSVSAWGAQLEYYSAAQGYIQTGVNPYIWSVSGNQVTFSAPPAAGTNLTWSGNYYYQVRFKQDLAQFDEFLSQLHQLKSVTLRGYR